MEGTIAVVTPVAYDFTPRNWLGCNGQILSIAQNQALFALLGTTYGGNGVNTFALPDLRGRTPVGVGQSTGSNFVLGEMGGSEGATLNQNNIPPHVHNGNVSIMPRGGNSQDAVIPTGGYPASITNGFVVNPATTVPMLSGTLTNTSIAASGSSNPLSILTPYLTVNFVICIYGLFPSRN